MQFDVSAAVGVEVIVDAPLADTCGGKAEGQKQADDRTCDLHRDKGLSLKISKRQCKKICEHAGDQDIEKDKADLDEFVVGKNFQRDLAVEGEDQRERKRDQKHRAVRVLVADQFVDQKSDEKNCRDDHSQEAHLVEVADDRAGTLQYIHEAGLRFSFEFRNDEAEVILKARDIRCSAGKESGLQCRRKDRYGSHDGVARTEFREDRHAEED